MALQRAGKLAFFSDLAHLADSEAFTAWLMPLRKAEWVVIVPEARLRHDAKPPFGGPEAVLAYLGRYTHRVAISNHRLVSADAETVAFRWKDYRIKRGERMKVMRLSTDAFIRRFLIHVLPDGFHRIRPYGLLASGACKRNVEAIRRLLGTAPTASIEATDTDPVPPLALREPCPDCGGVMRIVETFRRGARPMTRAPPRKAAV